MAAWHEPKASTALLRACPDINCAHLNAPTAVACVECGKHLVPRYIGNKPFRPKVAA